MNQTNPSAPRAILRSTAPQLFVTDMRRSCDFFRDKLGFGVVFLYGEPPFYGQVARDEVRLNLRHVDALLVDQAQREREDYLTASIRVDDVQRLYLEFQAAGVPFHRHLKKEDWGATTFIVKDPDGNLLLFLA
jgi:catechol 2,3-dioxygenase-like lactoylglutathione lyase family enzyme